ncbi:S41 family peptidase [Nannocystis punicea]|uniref:S41 family peptidase n=1 Tax=Nannocystis punicea TaxID=2995304 RepID=A0ABY7GV70_9BACT|nr:S41 family peptidase [Nannocystis poenicansa]WAS90866.1 S41 family peptidase [Nannocystis poenicansa]
MFTSTLKYALLILTCSLAACGDESRETPCTAASCCEDDPTACAAPTLSEAQALAAIDFVEQQLLTDHPRTLDGLPAATADAFDGARAAVSGPVTAHDLAGVLSATLATFADGHTRIELPAETRWLNLPLVFTTEGPVVAADAGELRRGDLLVELEGRADAALLTALAQYVPHENQHRVRAVAPTMLVREDVLAWLGVSGEQVRVVIERDGELLERSLAFEDEPPAAPEPQPARYEIDEARGVAVLRLDRCVYDAAFQATLDALLREARQREVHDLVIDLRHNEGGDVTVAVALFVRLGRPWSAFAVEQRASEGFFAAFPVFASPDVHAALAAFGVDLSAPLWKIPADAIAALVGGQLAPPTDEPFTGSVHALIGPRTFSSASLFAMMIRDNALGSLFGEPSGNAASFWGQNYALEILETGLTMQIATARNVRLAAEGRDAPTLTPDVSLELRREDVAAGEDRVLAEVYARLGDD